ncbi:hypothetical protein M3231_12260 [Neobacillus mesonae]|nr:hypothetical protein [Neobacillus mesonae]
MKAHIDWDYEGRNDFSSGTGAYASEKRLGLLSALVIPCFLLYLYWSKGVDWSVFQLFIALILAFDISGGLVSNALNSCKRFYHTPPKPQEGKIGIFIKNPLFFSLCHVHPFIAGLLHGEGNWTFSLLWYGLYMAAVLLVLAVPLYLKRPVSMLFLMLSILINFYIIEPVAGFEWLMPLLFIKIVYGHLVREEPYRK